MPLEVPGPRYTVDEVAAAMDVAPVTVRRWIQRGLLRATKLGRSYVIFENDFKVFIQEKFGVEAGSGEG